MSFCFNAYRERILRGPSYDELVRMAGENNGVLKVLMQLNPASPEATEGTAILLEHAVAVEPTISSGYDILWL